MTFPLATQDKIDTSKGFYDKYDNIPLCLGCVDGTHIAILAPKKQEKAYINRKHYHSINVMVSSLINGYALQY